MNENISNLLQKRSVIAGLVGAVAFTAGATAGYILGKRNAVTIVPAEPSPVGEQLQIDFDENGITVSGILTDNHVAELIRNGDIITRESHPALFAEVPESWIDGEIYIPDITQPAPEQSPEPVVVNIFAIEDPDWDYELELNNRDNETPYILHKDEFFADEMGFRQTTVTYYAGDDIMADEQETPVYNYTQLMGPLKWGHGSGDPNVVYIRNEKTRHEWEVVLHTGRFEVEVLGNEYVKELAEDELRHSANRRFRDV